jgi:hypothetical protein
LLKNGKFQVPLLARNNTEDGPVDVRVWINKYFSSTISRVFPSLSDEFGFQNE